jgi:hypothetical protein
MGELSILSAIRPPGDRARMLTPKQMDELSDSFAREGYLHLPAIVPADKLARLREDIVAAYTRVKTSGELFSGGGTISGHLNSFPGAESRFVYDALRDYGVFDLIRKIWPKAEREPNVGCNINLPGSSAQNFHIDGYAADAFIIANVAGVDTDLVNGATELSPGTHLHDYKYWQFVVAGHRSVRPTMKAGDVVIRPSSLWHRGMPNYSKAIRPMLSFSWENGGNELSDPYDIHGGRITFLPNRYSMNFVGKVRERAFAALPAVGSSYLFVRSLLGQ